MGSNKKKKTTMAKLNREQAVRERRALKKARKDARRQAAADEQTAAVQAPAGDHAEVTAAPASPVAQSSTSSPS